MMEEVNQFTGTCPQCGAHYSGRALSRQWNQYCVKCGSPLDVLRDGEVFAQSYSCFKMAEYRIFAPQRNS
jgi:hypothetical protein